MRHAGFAIGQIARDRWLRLMSQALDQAALPIEVDQLLRAFFADTTTFLINRAGG
jgi:hemoglobin